MFFALPSPFEGEGIFQREARTLEKLGEGGKRYSI